MEDRKAIIPDWNVTRMKRKLTMTMFWEITIESKLLNQFQWSWYHSFQKTMFYLMKSKYAIFLNIKGTKIERSNFCFLGHPVYIFCTQKDHEIHIWYKFCMSCKWKIRDHKVEDLYMHHICSLIVSNRVNSCDTLNLYIILYFMSYYHLNLYVYFAKSISETTMKEVDLFCY